MVALTGGPDVAVDLTFAELDQLLARFGTTVDVVVVPAISDPGSDSAAPLAEWLRGRAAGGTTVLGVCYGAGVLAAAGILDGRDATSHWLRLPELRHRYPETRWHSGSRYVEDGNVITTAGVLSGVDGALRVVERHVGAVAARQRSRAQASRPQTSSRRSTSASVGTVRR